MFAEPDRRPPTSTPATFPAIYEDLRRLASRWMTRERPDHTLSATSLVHEAYLRLLRDSDSEWRNAAHLYVAAVQAMRRVLVERARRHGRLRHGGGARRVPLDPDAAPAAPRTDQLLSLDEALTRLAALDGRKSDIVVLRYFADLSINETATVLGLSERTVKREWQLARAWLHCEMAK